MRRRPALAGRDSRQPRGALLVDAGGLMHEPGGGVREERGRRAGVAELLAQDRELDHAEPLAAVLLGDRDARPAEVADLLPERVVVGARLRRLADLRRGLKRLAEDLAGRLLDLALLVVEVRSPCGSSASLGRPSTRSATMFFITSVVPPSIELARRAKQAVGPLASRVERLGAEDVGGAAR